MWPENFQIYKLKNQRPICQYPLDHRKSKRISEKHLLLLHWHTKAFDCMDHNKLWKILKEMGIPDHLTCLLRNLYSGQDATEQSEQQTGSKLREEYVKAIHCQPAYLTYMQSTSWEMLGWKNHKLESRLLGEISITSDPQICRWHHPYGRKWRGTKKPLDESEGEWKSWLKAQHSENKIMASGPITSWEIDGETVETVSDFIFLGLQNHCRWWLQPWN